ncbi:MAG: hypothetical protein ACLQU3_31525 [Limisphaerales bacterium]
MTQIAAFKTALDATRPLFQFGESSSPARIVVEPLFFGVVAVLLWFEFYQVLRRRVV